MAWGTDKLWINPSLAVEYFPFVIDSTNYSFTGFDLGLNIVGLGYESNLLYALSSMGAIASQTWGLALGWQGVQSNLQTDGELVIGGYDSVQIDDQSASYAIGGDACRSLLEVTISDITVNFSNGSSLTSLMQPSGFNNSGSAIRACLSLDDPPIALPTSIFEKLRSVTNLRTLGSSKSRWPGGTAFDSQNTFDYDITVTLHPGLNIRIPNHQLVIPSYSFNNAGFLEETNSSISELLIVSQSSLNDNPVTVYEMPVLGRSFLSSAYLFVDEDRGNFTLRKGSPTAKEPKLIRNGLTACDRGTTISDPSPDSGSLPEPDASESSYLALKPELPSDRQPPQEMPLEQNPSYVIAPYEMAARKQRAELRQTQRKLEASDPRAERL
ncbi:MAG: hypothetical protein Q9225_002019 [Loekoesia sp. 1 TL-2023]